MQASQNERWCEKLRIGQQLLGNILYLAARAIRTPIN
jgi:hypothetical protein